MSEAAPMFAPLTQEERATTSEVNVPTVLAFFQ